MNDYERGRRDEGDRAKRWIIVTFVLCVVISTISTVASFQLGLSKGEREAPDLKLYEMQASQRADTIALQADRIRALNSTIVQMLNDLTYPDTSSEAISERVQAKLEFFRRADIDSSRAILMRDPE